MCVEVSKTRGKKNLLFRRSRWSAGGWTCICVSFVCLLCSWDARHVFCWCRSGGVVLSFKPLRLVVSWESLSSRPSACLCPPLHSSLWTGFWVSVNLFGPLVYLSFLILCLSAWTYTPCLVGGGSMIWIIVCFLCRSGPSRRYPLLWRDWHVHHCSLGGSKSSSGQLSDHICPCSWRSVSLKPLKRLYSCFIKCFFPLMSVFL